MVSPCNCSKHGTVIRISKSGKEYYCEECPFCQRDEYKVDLENLKQEKSDNLSEDNDAEKIRKKEANQLALAAVDMMNVMENWLKRVLK